MEFAQRAAPSEIALSMLPSVVTTPLWYLVVVAWPVVQSLHCVRAKDVDTKLWLFYWLCFVAGWLLQDWLAWAIHAPFYVLSLVIADIYAEAQLICACYLLLPRTQGLRRLKTELSKRGGSAVGGAISAAMAKFASSIPAAPAGSAAKPFKDRPGTYTIVKAAGVMPTKMTAKGTVLAKLNIGDVVKVLEVDEVEEERRVRALLEEPPGWISLLNMDTGARWAVHEADVGQRSLLPAVGPLPQQASDIFASAAAAGCNPSALFQQPGATAAAAPEASPEQAWEAMALLESQLARADDSSEDAGSRQAAGMLKTMLTTLVQTGNPAMVVMAQAMVPDLGKIWANAATREYLQGLLGAGATAAAAVAAAGPSSSS